MSTFNWNTIESDPGIFTEMVEKLGCPNIQFKELYSLDDIETLDRIKPIEGIVLLFEYDKRALTYFQSEFCGIDTKEYPDLFFAKQVVNNACATQAILSVLLNLKTIDVGSTLQQFKESAMKLSPYDRGVAIGKSDIIRKTHNEFAQPSQALQERISNKFSGVTGKAHHFIGIIPYNGILLMLDGLSEDPIVIGGAEDDWVTTGVKPFFEGLCKALSGSLDFTILAVVHNQVNKYKELYERAVEEKSDMATTYKSMFEEEIQKRKKEREENTRRKHDYMPLALHVLLLMGKYGKLEQQVTRAEEEAQKS
ncbi:ubiquitin carboxyl-terminal hydrolase isozyme L5, putative [Entamoeba invadens IP1]|uniref:Ubiquitin carboxyl-terminal hydrolase n=1 Tax=Entamoeba invadens IP1 TaxID=370355 RepID=A0A0A1U0G2_ENTIV|nr:ubiquitin carboxyl-terminal hydrolase isozyme L5, putative [Entamoeba invadens IP1]ELP87367.1 ubiquitin carboxyl-terminal hydrolase isozyme L5, putative [Entamoeba invadens IP1]|eukprot:XP_004254138.1 ubiquitin carboxyl-terminal hydrolase isozyme L5, putative [Entamoeba invadens IP1]